MSVPDYTQWVRDGQRVTAGFASGGGAHAVGRVIAFTDRPTLLIETDDGRRVTWIADLCTITHAADCEGCELCDELLMDIDPMEKYLSRAARPPYGGNLIADELGVGNE